MLQWSEKLKVDWSSFNETLEKFEEEASKERNKFTIVVTKLAKVVDQ